MSLPLYCAKCGAETEWVMEEVGRFDPFSGYHIDRTRAVCPNKGSHYDGHTTTEWEYDSHPPDHD